MGICFSSELMVSFAHCMAFSKFSSLLLWYKGVAFVGFCFFASLLSRPCKDTRRAGSKGHFQRLDKVCFFSFFFSLVQMGLSKERVLYLA